MSAIPNANRWPKGSPKKIAVTLAGAGSLGAYEAGVITELAYALETMNAALKAQGDPEPFRIDVITGASAGGMTGALLARAMLYDPATRDSLFKAWVQSINITGLLQNDPQQTNALLSKTVIQQIAKTYLVDPPTTVTARSTFAPDPTLKTGDLWTRELLLTLALSNMDGFDYELPTTGLRMPPPDPFLATRFADAAQFAFNSDTFPTLDWSVVCTSAVAGGNFPIAFQPQQLARAASDYPDGPLQLKTMHWPAALTYVDGGMFNNEPLSNAIDLAGRHDPDGAPDPNRLFLMVHPNITRSDHTDSIKSDSSIVSQAGRLLDMLMTESSLDDWVWQNQVNDRSDWRDDFVKELVSIVKTTAMPADDATALAARLQQLALRIAGSQAYLTESLASIRSRFASAYSGLGPTPSTILGYVLFVLNHVSGLQRRSKLWFEVIGHNQKKALAGSHIGGFAGFFSPEFRTYDYRRGRLDAWKALSGWEAPGEGDPGWTEEWWNGTTLIGARNPDHAILGAYDMEPLASQSAAGGPRTAATDSDYYTATPYWATRSKIPSFPAVTFANVDPNLQSEVEDRILDRVKSVLGLSGVTGWIAGKFLSGKIDDLLKSL